MRSEEDFIGKIDVPDNAYYGIFTVRADKNFKLSSSKVHMELIRAVILIKKCAALANMELQRLPKKEGDAIVQAAEEALAGKFDKEFILDAFQAGAGTPLHMNVNEVLANRAEEILGGELGKYRIIHPNNHVNMSQSSNNVVPSAVRIAAIKLSKPLIEEAKALQKSFEKKAAKYSKTIKIGRTHLQDAVPITYGQTFAAWASALEKDIRSLESSAKGLQELGIGGTAVGSGITAHPKFREKIIEFLNNDVKVVMAKDAIELTQNMNDLLEFSASMRRYASTISRIANDLRLLSSGPKAAIAEVILPEVEPGSSIMPGKLNPSVPEAVNMVSFQVVANDLAVMLGAQSGQLELNFCAPLIAHNIIQSEELLTNCNKMFAECIEGTKIDEKKTKENFDRTFGYATALNPYLGYSRVSKLVSEAYRMGVTLKELVVQKGIMSNEDLEQIIATANGPSEIDPKIKERIK
ncbi:aspartate ammonia-lyase [Candidatus Micrarchaeota archaeon]|nr:aspartate ammonia-lyase [Candidatus Micrarchaeota archaeon]MBU1681654.1 aspartate ammonia-lyase [Candidatus Micrarchaeota archaeon]